MTTCVLSSDILKPEVSSHFSISLFAMFIRLGSFHTKTDKKVPTLSELAIIDVMYSLPISVERSKISKPYLEPFRRDGGEELSISQQAENQTISLSLNIWPTVGLIGLQIHSQV